MNFVFILTASALRRDACCLTVRLDFCPHSAPMFAPDANNERLVLFENNWLEKLTVVSAFWFVVTWSVLLPVVAIAGWGQATPLAGFGLVVAGVIVWTLFEYVVHRYLFHWDAQWLWAKRFVFLLHGNHHARADDRLRNLMPPILSIPISLCIWAMFVAAIGPAGTWLFLGFLLGYVAYDLVHYACHQWPMRGALGEALKRHHMRHHHVDDEMNYAITGIFWDRLFSSRITSLRR